MTSNIGSQILVEPDITQEEKERRVEEEIKKYFKPEFINRLDEIVFYNSINKETLKGILEIQLNIMANRVKDKGLDLQFSQELKSHLLGMGFDTEYGARPLKRLIQKEVGNALSEFILKGDYIQGEKVSVTYLSEKVGVVKLK